MAKRRTLEDYIAAAITPTSGIEARCHTRSPGDLCVAIKARPGRAKGYIVMFRFLGESKRNKQIICHADMNLMRYIISWNKDLSKWKFVEFKQ